MIRTGNEYRQALRDGREVWINGEKVRDVTTHPSFKPVVDIRARIYDMQHEPATRDVMTYEEKGERFAIGLRLPFEQKDWSDKRTAVDAVTHEIGGVVTRVGDETIGEMWSLWDGKDILNEIDPRFAQQHRASHPRSHQVGSLPRLGQHRPQGRPFQAAPGPGPRHAGARGQGDRRRHRHSRRQIRNRGGLRRSGVPQADHRQLGRCQALGICAWLHRQDECAGRPAHLPHRFRRPRAGARLSARQPIRRDRHAGHPRQRSHPLGGRAVLSAHAGGRLHPPDPAPLLGLPVRPAYPFHGRPDDRRGAVECPADRPREAAGGAGEALRAGDLARGHQRAPDGCRLPWASGAPMGC